MITGIGVNLPLRILLAQTSSTSVDPFTATSVIESVRIGLQNSETSLPKYDLLLHIPLSFLMQDVRFRNYSARII